MRVKREFVEEFAAQEARRRIYHTVERYRLRLASKLLLGMSYDQYNKEKERIEGLLDLKNAEETKKYFED